jgi:hypothetical protein
MSDHTGPHERETPTTALQERVHLLEVRVAALTEALQILARGLEDLPTAEPGGRPAAEAARRAHDLLLATTQPRRES